MGRLKEASSLILSFVSSRNMIKAKQDYSCRIHNKFIENIKLEKELTREEFLLIRELPFSVFQTSEMVSLFPLIAETRDETLFKELIEKNPEQKDIFHSVGTTEDWKQFFEKVLSGKKSTEEKSKDEFVRAFVSNVYPIRESQRSTGYFEASMIGLFRNFKISDDM